MNIDERIAALEAIKDVDKTGTRLSRCYGTNGDLGWQLSLVHDDKVVRFFGDTIHEALVGAELVLL